MLSLYDYIMMHADIFVLLYVDRSSEHQNLTCIYVVGKYGTCESCIDLQAFYHSMKGILVPTDAL